MNKKMTALIILDGFGLSNDTYGNAIKTANTSYLDYLMTSYPNISIGASGMDVGLPVGQMGNSEVGHLNLGAGRIVYQELTRISKSIADGDFFKNQELLFAIQSAKRNNTKLHIYGLLSDGGVHSHMEHLFAIIKLAKQEQLENVYIHCFLDGRDVPPRSGADYIKQLQDFLDKENYGEIASVMGRYYAMDRDNRWERIQKAYDALTLGEGDHCINAENAVRESYAIDVTDEFVYPHVVYKDRQPIATISKGDSIIFFNFRPDRARQLTRAFITKDFHKIDRKSGYLAPVYVGMTQYDATFENIRTAFSPQNLEDTLGEVISKNNLKQLRIAETEKYAHVTFFFNGGVEQPNENEDRVLIPSPKVATYDLQPEMSAMQIANQAVELINSNKYDVMILNFANCDMVGHTGIFDAAVKAVEAVDIALKITVEAIKAQGGDIIITADHGNADQMYDTNGEPFTAHTTNPVPLVLVSDKPHKLRATGILADIAPTILDLLNIPKPQKMTGQSLITE